MAPTPLRMLSLFAVLAAVTGCASLLPSGWMDKDEDLTDLRGELNFGEEERVVGSYVVVAGGTGHVVIEGVGLVTGLADTGGDVPPSAYRRNIKDDMKRRRVKNPDQLLRSPTTAVVMVRAFIPPLHRKGDPLDIEVTLPPKSDATSLRGGWLLPCSLFESRALASGTSLKGRELGAAVGPVLISPTGDRDIKDAATLRKGVIPAGGRFIGDNLSMTLNLRNDYQSIRMAKRIADYIGRRFHDFDEYGIQVPMAEAKTDTRIVLDIPEIYQDNPGRYLKVMKRIHLKETPLETRLRMEALREALGNPATSEDAALELEAIGRDAKPILREALESESLVCRFQAAAALAYLGDEIGAPHLAEAARSERALRVWALAAMSAMDGGEAIDELQTLLSEESIETRYGAIRAITTVDPGHPVVAGREITDRCMMRLIESDAPPVVHITKSQKSEITLFGPEQEFTLPLAVRAGNNLLVTGQPGDGVVKISRFVPGEEDQQRTVQPRVADVLTACAELGARYPDLVSLLLEAESQHNLAGTIAIDALPQGGRIYTEKPDGDEEETDDESMADASMAAEDTPPFLGFEEPEEKLNTRVIGGDADTTVRSGLSAAPQPERSDDEPSEETFDGVPQQSEPAMN